MIRSCPSCGKKNRIPAAHLADTGRCGACKSPLPPLAEPVDADPALFDEVLSQVKVPVLIDFWAAWCGPCRMVAPEVKAAAREMAGQALVLKVDTEAWPDLAQRFRVMSIPNLVVLKHGRPVHQQAGAVGHQQMTAWLRDAGA